MATKEPMLKNEPKPNGHEDPQAKRKELTDAMRAEMSARAEKCNAEVEVILKKYNCVIGAQAFITEDGRTSARAGIIPR